ncbi:phage integrase N-terminal SAM-like domain-containing protein [Vibrio ouci]|uniref:phage integrase N-terminal SAM-like domain-containing protein n=1 Tax=Vibrio ouci TaxID=2499078 RepID=UPI001FC9EDE4|nr:phage integrase N-terminal SAM-like domain-containing protein [Vibrio ouci]
MTPLRQQFIDEMTLRRFSPRTHECYLYWVVELSKTYQSSLIDLVMNKSASIYAH